MPMLLPCAVMAAMVFLCPGRLTPSSKKVAVEFVARRTLRICGV